jgi:hypothetical protein
MATGLIYNTAIINIRIINICILFNDMEGEFANISQDTAIPISILIKDKNFPPKEHKVLNHQIKL